MTLRYVVSSKTIVILVLFLNNLRRDVTNSCDIQNNFTFLRNAFTYASEPQLRVRDFCLSLSGSSDLAELTSLN